MGREEWADSISMTVLQLKVLNKGISPTRRVQAFASERTRHWGTSYITPHKLPYFREKPHVRLERVHGGIENRLKGMAEPREILLQLGNLNNPNPPTSVSSPSEQIQHQDRPPPTEILSRIPEESRQIHLNPRTANLHLQ